LAIRATRLEDHHPRLARTERDIQRSELRRCQHHQLFLEHGLDDEILVMDWSAHEGALDFAAEDLADEIAARAGPQHEINAGKRRDECRQHGREAQRGRGLQ